VSDYARTALMEMLRTAIGPDLAGALGCVAGQRPVLDALIEGLGPVVSSLLQVTLGLGGRAAVGAVSLGQAEEALRTSGRDLMRATLQAVVAAASAAQERVPGGVDGPDGVRRTRVEDDHIRTVATVLGRITVDRLAYPAPHVCNVHPLDEVLDLPDGLYSTGLARLSAREAVRGSFVEAADAVEYVTGVRIGTRQLIELTRTAAQDVANYYTDHHWHILDATPTGPSSRSLTMPRLHSMASARSRWRRAHRLRLLRAMVPGGAPGDPPRPE